MRDKSRDNRLGIAILGILFPFHYLFYYGPYVTTNQSYLFLTRDQGHCRDTPEH